LLLRASSEVNGRAVDLHVLTDSARAAESSVASAPALIALADAMVGDDDNALAGARERLHQDLGSAQLVDSVAVASNFERMVRIADATGIPLDDPVEIMTAGVRAELGIDRFTAAANTPPPGPLRRLLAPIMRPLLGTLMRVVGGRMGT
jgi:hypothetical protein